MVLLPDSVIRSFRTGKAFQNGFAVYIAFLLVGQFIYHRLGGNFQATDAMDRLYYISTFLEALGLLMVRAKVQKQESVAGVSGMTMGMYAWAYTIRAAMLPEFKWQHIDLWAFEALDVFALILVLDLNWSIFKTYRNTWQSELDTMKIRYLVPVCIICAFILHPDLKQGTAYNIAWTICLNLDTVALMPQVYMMSRAGDQVEAPIAHFVAATAFSRFLDVVYWYYGFNMVAPRGGGFNFSGYLIMVAHGFGCLLLADFVYYYLKSRFSVKRGLDEAMNLPVEGLYEIC